MDRKAKKISALLHEAAETHHIVYRITDGDDPELVEQVKTLEGQGLRQIMLYPPLNRQYRVIEDFADNVMARL